MDNNALPTADEILARIKFCRVELDELKKLYRTRLSIDKANQARQARSGGDQGPVSRLPKGGGHG